MGNCGSSTNKREHQQHGKEQKDITKSRAKPNNERSIQQSEPTQPKEEIKCTPLKITIKQKEETILEGEYDREKTIEDIYSLLHLDPNKDYEVLYEGNPLSMKLSSKIKEICDIHVNTIELNINYIGLNISDNCRNRYEETSQYIGTLLLDNSDSFCLVRYDKTIKQISSFNYTFQPGHILNHFGSFSAFCNANNKIYLSGGETQAFPSENIRYFVEINLETANRESIEVKQLPNLNEPRAWHSMIFVPDSKIFIVGGIDCQSVEIYDIETNTINFDSKINEKRGECTLCLVNNLYLYAFFGFILHQNYLQSIERCNLGRKVRNWEIVDIEYENNVLFVPSFFAVAYCKRDILLLGGSDNAEEREKNYLVQIEDNNSKVVIRESNSFKNVAGIYKEKFFIPINSDESVLLPLVSENIKLLVMDERIGNVIKEDFGKVEESERS